MESTSRSPRVGICVPPNPVGSTATFSLSLSEYLNRTHNLDSVRHGFDHAKTGVFVPGFDPLDFERKCTLLLTGLRVRSCCIPDSERFDGEMENEREISLFYSLDEGNLPLSDRGGTVEEKT